jgi:hypothetical protein
MPKRRGAAAADCAGAANAGTIDSRNGRASDAPIPRSTVRRDSDIFVTNISVLL